MTTSGETKRIFLAVNCDCSLKVHIIVRIPALYKWHNYAKIVVCFPPSPRPIFRPDRLDRDSLRVFLPWWINIYRLTSIKNEMEHANASASFAADQRKQFLLTPIQSPNKVHMLRCAMVLFIYFTCIKFIRTWNGRSMCSKMILILFDKVEFYSLNKVHFYFSTNFAVRHFIAYLLVFHIRRN